MSSQSSNMYLLFGRYLLALYFLVPGVAKLLLPELQLALMYRHSIFNPPLLLHIAASAQIIGALALLSNRHVRIASFGFVLYILIINFSMHDFWNYSGGSAAREIQSFIKNLGILAGLLVLASISVKRPLEFKTVFRSDRKFS